MMPISTFDFGMSNLSFILLYRYLQSQSWLLPYMLTLVNLPATYSAKAITSACSSSNAKLRPPMELNSPLVAHRTLTVAKWLETWRPNTRLENMVWIQLIISCSFKDIKFSLLNRFDLHWEVEHWQYPWNWNRHPGQDCPGSETHFWLHLCPSNWVIYHIK